MKLARLAVGAGLAAWALGLAVATVQLQQWEQALAPVLLQMRADTLVRQGADRAGDTVLPEWYRRRALALLDAVEHLHYDQWWTLVMPGSWEVFDDLEERATRRVGEAFSQVVVETIRRELEARSARLTGLPAPDADCRAPSPPAQPPAGLDLAALPEYAAMQRLLDEAQGLDQSVAALRALRQGGEASSAQLRTLVRHSLGAQLSGPASRSLALFRAAPDPQDPQFDALGGRLQWALRCSALKGVAALHERLVERNPVLALEDEMARLQQAMPLGADDAGSHAQRVARLREMVLRVAEGEAQLAAGGTAWMAPDSEGFGPAHAQMLERVAAVGLLGPQLADRLHMQAQADHARLQKQVRQRLARPDAGLAWQADTGSFVVGRRPAALAVAVAALLREPFMAANPPVPASPADLVGLVDQRLHFSRAVLPLFPGSLRPAVSRYVEWHIDELAFEGARQMLAEPGEPPDVALQRLLQLEAALHEAGAPALATWLGQRLAVEVLSCVSPAMPGCAAQPDPRAPWDNEAAHAAPAPAAD